VGIQECKQAERQQQYLPDFSANKSDLVITRTAEEEKASEEHKPIDDL
jgi:hypothetical protein